jgi:hypothetical protein
MPGFGSTVAPWSRVLEPVKKFPTFMEIKGSLPRSQKPVPIPSMPGSNEWSLPFVLSKKFICISHRPFHATCPTNLIRIDAKLQIIAVYTYTGALEMCNKLQQCHDFKCWQYILTNIFMLCLIVSVAMRDNQMDGDVGWIDSLAWLPLGNNTFESTKQAVPYTKSASLVTQCYAAGCLGSPNTTLLVLVTWPVMEGEVKFLFNTVSYSHYGSCHH